MWRVALVCLYLVMCASVVLLPAICRVLSISMKQEVDVQALPTSVVVRGAAMDMYYSYDAMDTPNCGVDRRTSMWLKPGDCVDGQYESFRFLGCASDQVGIRRYGAFACSGTVMGTAFYNVDGSCVKVSAFPWGVAVIFDCGTR